MEEYRGGKYSIAAGSMMIRYAMLNKLIFGGTVQLFNPNGEINIYINLESVLYNLFKFKGLIETVEYHKDKFALELESSIINLVGHYRSYFIGKNFKPNIFLFLTDLKKEYQEMSVINPYYRDYYYNKYMQDPHFASTGELLHSIVFPEVQLILSYIQNCYLIKSKGFDGSLIPMMIQNRYENQSILITSDLFDTMYMYGGVTRVFCMRRRYSELNILTFYTEVIESILKSNDENDVFTFLTYPHFRLLLSVHGSKIRNIKSAKGFGYQRLKRTLEVLKERIILIQY